MIKLTSTKGESVYLDSNLIKGLARKPRVVDTLLDPPVEFDAFTNVIGANGLHLASIRETPEYVLTRIRSLLMQGVDVLPELHAAAEIGFTNISEKGEVG